MILIQLQRRQTFLEISKIEPHLNTEGNGLALQPKLCLFPINAGVHLEASKRRKKYEQV